MEEFAKKRVLITVKTYPTPSSKYVETVCTAGITSDGKWIRLYPIKFRFLQDKQKYRLFSWVDVEVKKSKDDARPESYKVNSESIKVISELHPEKDLEEKRALLLPLCRPSLETLYDEIDTNGASLGMFKPKSVTGIKVTQLQDREWNQDEIAKLNQMSIFDNESERKLLEKIPYRFFLEFVCNDERCPGHSISINSWEINETYRSFLRKYRSETEAINKLKAKWMSMFCDSCDYYLFVGTTRSHKKFIIIGHLSYPLKNIRVIPGQISLYDNP